MDFSESVLSFTYSNQLRGLNWFWSWTLEFTKLTDFGCTFNWACNLRTVVGYQTILRTSTMQLISFNTPARLELQKLGFHRNTIQILFKPMNLILTRHNSIRASFKLHNKRKCLKRICFEYIILMMYTGLVALLVKLFWMCLNWTKTNTVLIQIEFLLPLGDAYSQVKGCCWATIW